MSDLEPYTSGYMKPPKHSRFKSGKSGNPQGRPKQPLTPYTALQKALRRKVTVSGEDKKIRLDEALIRRLRDLAHGGDRRAIAMHQKIMALSDTNIPERPDVDLQAAKERFIQMIAEEETAEALKEENGNG